MGHKRKYVIPTLEQNETNKSSNQVKGKIIKNAVHHDLAHKNVFTRIVPYKDDEYGFQNNLPSTTKSEKWTVVHFSLTSK